MTVMSKRCDRCKIVDETEFSKCKRCGAKYEAASIKPVGKKFELGMWPVLGIVLLGLWFFYEPTISKFQGIMNGTDHSSPSNGRRVSHSRHH